MDLASLPWEKAFNYGLPTVLLLLMVWMLYRGASWLGNHFLLPLKDRIVKFLDNLEAAVAALSKQAEGWHCNYPENGCANFSPGAGRFGPQRPPEARG